MKIISKNLSALMAEKEIKSAELARKIGVGQPVIHRLMTGVTDNPQVYTLQPIAHYFNVSIEQLINEPSTQQGKTFNAETLHAINNKVTTAKTIANALNDFMPKLIEGYRQAVTVNLIPAHIPEDLLLLISLNINNLIDAITHLQLSFVNQK